MYMCVTITKFVRISFSMFKKSNGTIHILVLSFFLYVLYFRQTVLDMTFNVFVSLWCVKKVFFFFKICNLTNALYDIIKTAWVAFRIIYLYIWAVNYCWCKFHKQRPYRHRQEETQYNHRDHQCRQEQPQHNQENRSLHTRIFIR